MRKLILAFLVLALTVTSANAQNVSVFANTSNLEVNTGESDLHCIALLSDGSVVGFNSDARAIVSSSGASGATVLRTATQIDGDITGTTDPINRCDAVAVDAADNIYFSFRDGSGGTNTNFIYKTDSGGSSSTVTDAADGVNSLAVANNSLYLGANGNFSSNLDNGIYTLPLDLSGTPSSVYLDPDISFDVAFDFDSAGNIILATDDNGSTANQDKIIQITNLSTTPAASILTDPFSSTLSTGGLVDLEVVSFAGADRIVVLNNSFNATDGEEVAVFQLDGSGTVLANESSLVAASPDISGFTTGFTEPLAANADGDVFLANRNDFGGADQIILLADSPLPVELATFDGRFTGEGIALSWQTLSETSNAGFELQHMAPNASSFASAGFVEGNGTTNQVSDYSFFLNTAQAGTHTFRLLQVDVDGDETLSAPITVEVMGDPVALTGPNPATPGAQVEVLVKMDASQNVDIAVYNLLGQKVATIYNGPAAKDQTLRNAVDVSSLASGVYFVRVLGETMSATEKLSIVK